MRFKTELSLLLLSMTLFIASAFCYSFETSAKDWGAPVVDNPFRTYSFPILALASVFLATGAALYSRNKKS